MTDVEKEPVDLAPLQGILERAGRVRDTDLIPLLQEIQEVYGYLPSAVLAQLSQRTGIPTSRMFGVVTFYSQFHLKPHGRHTIRSCRGTACHVRGGRVVSEAIARHLGIGEGETTADNLFTFETVACLGTCFLAPAMMVGSDYYGLLTPEKIKAILGRYSPK
ncbi:MAG: NADH-quinone oxidoreductase subunit NuoE [Planctomycetota bacterium]|nr:NADH-quinone oxidoreductase subunit NuoE [Planctomycetota bacterium]